MFMALIKKVKIVYFSGTGGTTRIANYVCELLEAHGIDVKKIALEKDFWSENNRTNNRDFDLIMVLFAVYAFDAPEPVYKWIKTLPKGNGIPVAVISVSGGGEVSINSACRAGSIKKLEKKGYNTIYEKMMVMPSNWIVATNEQIAMKLIQILPYKTEYFVYELLKGVKRRTRPKILGKILSIIFKIEKPCAKIFAKSLKIRQSCNSCGWCAQKCPTGNIEFSNGKPIFKWSCIICLRCVYGCHQNAIYTNIFSFIILKEGYNLNDLENRLNDFKFEPIENIDFGVSLKGVKKYLLEK